MCLICEILGNDLIDKVYFLRGSIPVSFATLKKHRVDAAILQFINEKKSNHYIAGKVPRSRRTISRRRTALLGKSKKKRSSKK